MENEILKGRLTAKKILAWINFKFEKAGLAFYEATEIKRTRHSKSQYESGAARIIIKFKDKTLAEDSIINGGYFLGFYTIAEYGQYLKDGYSLHLKTDRFGILANTELDIKK